MYMIKTFIEKSLQNQIASIVQIFRSPKNNPFKFYHNPNNSVVVADEGTIFQSVWGKFP